MESLPRLQELGRYSVERVAVASALFEAGHIEEALAELDETLWDNPESALARYTKGFILASTEAMEEAEHEFFLATCLDDALTDAWYSLAYARWKLGKTREALPAADAALRRDPSREDVLLLKAGLLQELERHEEAIAVYQRVLEGNHDQETALYEIGLHHIAEARWNEAESVLLHLRDVSPSRWETHVALGDAYRGKNDAGRAEEEYKLASLLADTEALPRAKLGDLFLHEKRLPEAMVSFQAASMLDSQQVDVLLKLGRIYRDLQVPEQAAAFARAAGQVAPENEEVREFLDGLEARNAP